MSGVTIFVHGDHYSEVYMCLHSSLHVCGSTKSSLQNDLLEIEMHCYILFEFGPCCV